MPTNILKDFHQFRKMVLHPLLSEGNFLQKCIKENNKNVQNEQKEDKIEDKLKMIESRFSSYLGTPEYN